MLDPNDTPPPVRETATGNIEWSRDPTRQNAESEPVIEVAKIQGNIIGGFNKDRQCLLFLRLRRDSLEANVTIFKHWLAELLPDIATAEEVLAFNSLFKQVTRRRRSEFATLKATWVNVALSFDALRLLDPESDQFLDEAFRQNLAERAIDELNDPIDPEAEGNPKNWRFGKVGEEADVVLIVASDEESDLERMIEALVSRLPPQLEQLGRVNGATLTGPMRGHEHFGFLDGISQPGLRGRASLDPFDVLTRRQNPADPGQGKPGQDLIWPGEFVFGYPGQDPRAADIAQPGPDSLLAPDGRPAGPAWARNGSYLVVRRLRQDVTRFREFLRNTANSLGVNPDLLGAKLVGRWQSGAPILRAPDADSPALGANDCANNHFEFREDGEHVLGEGDEFCSDASFPVARADIEGNVCPFAAHIRKTYTRDDSSPSQSELGEVSAQTHRILRRGIPFDDGDDDRGLLFACYQTSIVEQFEFLQRAANDPDFKEPGAGHDLILGQRNGPGNDRTRRCPVRIGDVRHEIAAPRDFVIATGGGYFFAPSVDALERLAAHSGK